MFKSENKSFFVNVRKKKVLRNEAYMLLFKFMVTRKIVDSSFMKKKINYEKRWKQRIEWMNECINKGMLAKCMTPPDKKQLFNVQLENLNQFIQVNLKWWPQREFIYIHKVVISVCLFVCPIITQKPLDRFASSFDWGTR